MTLPHIDRTTNQVVNNAFYLIGLVNPNESVPGYYTDEAIYLLNALLDHYMAVERLLPYFLTLSFALSAGKNEYLVGPKSSEVTSEKIASIGQASIIFNNVSYPLEQIKYYNLDGISYTTNLRARPTVIILQNEVYVSKLILYPIPDRDYEIKLQIKEQIGPVYDQSLLIQVPVDYHRFLTYALARELSSVFRVAKAWTPILENEYQTMKQNLMDNADIELGADGNRGQLNLPFKRFGSWNMGVSY
jgi:hypothetical protein